MRPENHKRLPLELAQTVSEAFNDRLGKPEAGSLLVRAGMIEAHEPGKSGP